MGLRTIFNDLFKRGEYQDLVAKVDKIVADTAIVLTAVASLAQSVGAMNLGEISSKLDKLLQDTMSVWCENVEGVQVGDVITIPVYIKGDPVGAISSFGMEVQYDSNVLLFKRVSVGGRTITWNTVDGNEATPGVVTVGGYAGSGNPIEGANVGELFVIEFDVTAQFSEIVIQLNNYLDDIKGFTPEPFYGTIKYQEPDPTP